METVGWAVIAGLLLRELVQLVVEWRKWQDSRPRKVIAAVVLALPVAWLFSLLPGAEFTEAFVGEVWLAATTYDFAKKWRDGRRELDGGITDEPDAG